MRITLLTFCCALLGFTQVSAQLLLTNASYSTYAGTTDSVSYAYGSLPSLATGANATWDLSTITYTYVDTPLVTHNPGPIGSLYADYVHNIISGNLYYNSRPYFVIDATSFRQPGESIDRRSYGLYGVIIGASTTDSIIFLQQTDVYTSALTKVAFPATYNSNWSSNYTSDVQLTITYSSAYNNTPGIFRSNSTEYDTVIGWGQMKVKQPDGFPSTFMDVLLVKVNNQRMDSFYVGGSSTNPTPAPPALLSQFGLSQGMISTSYQYRFIRANEVTPLATVYFVNSNYDNTNVDHTVVHQQRLSRGDTTTAVATVANDSKNIVVYPNPITDNTLHISLPAGSNVWSYQLVDIIGQIASSGSFISNGQNTIQIPYATIPGMYYLRLNNNNELYVRPVNISR